MPFTLGLTGGIASGKSLAGQCFTELGIPMIDADQVSRNVVLPGSSGLNALVEHFGPEILDADGAMNRPAMRKRVFNDPDARYQLESTLHPFMREELLQFRDEALSTPEATYCVLMIPLLVKFGWTDLVDRLLVIDCPEETQLTRLLDRDDIDEALAQNMINSQDSRSQRLEAADDAILNNKQPQQLKTAVQQLHQQYLQLARGYIKHLPPQNL